MRIRFIPGLIWLMLFSFPLFGQLNTGGTPPSWALETLMTDYISMPLVDADRLMSEDRVLDTMTEMPWRFGENIPVALNPENSGIWTDLPGGGRIWQLGIHSEGALSLNLTIGRYRLPRGAELFVYAADRSRILGAFTHMNNQQDGVFATTLLPASSIVVEYYEPAGSEFPGELEINSVTHGYRDAFSYAKAFGQAGWCNVNVACDIALPWQNQIDAVVMMVVGSNGFCTGALVNNTSFNGRPLVLSANHCLRDPSTVVFWFNWQSAACANPSVSPPHDALSGAVTRARSSLTDFWLLELNHEVPVAYRPYYAGWNRSLESGMGGPIIGIHHPRGDIKKFSYAQGVTAAAYLQDSGVGSSHWRVVWSGGTTTEGGSSGSPLFDSSGRIIGQLHGGWAACGNTDPDWYGRFGLSWTGGGNPTNRLSDWLDPLGSNPMAIDGMRGTSDVMHALLLQAAPSQSATLSGSGVYPEGSRVTVTATPAEGYTFSHWEENGQLVSAGNPFTFLLDRATSLTAVLTLNEYPVILGARGMGEINPGKGSFTYFHFDQLQLTAVPALGWNFRHWYVNGTYHYEPTLSMVIRGPLEAEASFRLAGSENLPQGEALSRVFPNPGNGTVSLAISGWTGKVDVEIYSMTGQPVYRTSVIAPHPDTIIPLRLEGISNGMYLLRITHEGASNYERLILY